MENFSHLLVYSELVSKALKIVQYTTRSLSSYTLFKQAAQKILNTSAGLRRFFRLFTTLRLLLKLNNAKVLTLSHLPTFTQLLFNLLDHLIIYYQKSPDAISGLVSLLRNLVWVLNCLTQIMIGCYKTALIRQKLQNLRDANAHNKYSEHRREYEKMMVKDKKVQMETVAWTFDLPLGIYCCEPQKLNSLFVACMGIISAGIEFCVDYERIR